MPIPDFQTIMLPVLRLTDDGGEHSQRDCVEALADQYHLTLDERNELLARYRFARR